MISKNATFNILNFSFPAACVTDYLSGLKKITSSYDLQKGKTNSTKHHEKPLFTILFACKTKIFESIQNSFNIRICGKNLIVVPSEFVVLASRPNHPHFKPFKNIGQKVKLVEFV